MAEVITLLGGFPGRSERGYLGWSSCHLVTADSGEQILFDTCGYNERATLVRALAERGLSPESISLVVLSHLHFDHGANWDLFPRAGIVVHERELAYAASAQADGAVLRFHGEALLRHPRLHPVSDEEELVRGVRLWHVPGHTPGAMALDARNGILCGDALKNRWDLGGKVSPPCWDEAQALRSIARLKEAGKLLYPGHDSTLELDGDSVRPLTTPVVRISLPDGSERRVAAPDTAVALPG